MPGGAREPTGLSPLLPEPHRCSATPPPVPRGPLQPFPLSISSEDSTALDEDSGYWLTGRPAAAGGSPGAAPLDLRVSPLRIVDALREDSRSLNVEARQTYKDLASVAPLPQGPARASRRSLADALGTGEAPTPRASLAASGLQWLIARRRCVLCFRMLWHVPRLFGFQSVRVLCIQT